MKELSHVEVDRLVITLVTSLLYFPMIYLYYGVENFNLGHLFLFLGSAVTSFILFHKTIYEMMIKKMVFALILSVFWLISSVKDILSATDFSILGFIIGLCFYTILFYLVLNFFCRPYERYKKGRQGLKKTSIHMNYYVLLFLVIEGVWFVYWLAFRPGIFTSDSLDQFGQALELRPLNSWHPIIHTLSLRVTYTLFSTTNAYFFITMTSTVLFIVFVLNRLNKLGLPYVVSTLIALFYAFYPINGFYMNTFWKDVPYSVLMLVYTYLVFEMFDTNGKKLKNITYLISFSLVTLLLLEFRKNSLLIVLLLGIVMLWHYKKQWKRLVLVFFVPLLCHSIIQGPVYQHLGFIKSPKSEALAVPMQQIAATYTLNGYIPTESKAFFNKILPEEEWSTNYDEVTVNPLKFSDNFDKEFVEDNMGAFLKHWAKTLRFNFRTYVTAYLKQMRAFWQAGLPDDFRVYLINSWRFADTFSFDTDYEKYTEQFTDTQPYLSKSDFDKLVGSTNKRLDKTRDSNSKGLKNKFDYLADRINNQPKYFANPGFIVLLLLIGVFSAILTKRSILFLPIFVNYLTLLLAAPATDFRYLYSSAFTLPIILFMLKIEKKCE